jgi:hypothetical protein
LVLSKTSSLYKNLFQNLNSATPSLFDDIYSSLFVYFEIDLFPKYLRSDFLFGTNKNNNVFTSLPFHHSFSSKRNPIPTQEQLANIYGNKNTNATSMTNTSTNIINTSTNTKENVRNKENFFFNSPFKHASSKELTPSKKKQQTQTIQTSRREHTQTNRVVMF